jgi:hypothetical protein
MGMSIRLYDNARTKVCSLILMIWNVLVPFLGLMVYTKVAVIGLVIIGIWNVLVPIMGFLIHVLTDILRMVLGVGMDILVIIAKIEMIILEPILNMISMIVNLILYIPLSLVSFLAGGAAVLGRAWLSGLTCNSEPQNPICMPPFTLQDHTGLFLITYGVLSYIAFKKVYPIVSEYLENYFQAQRQQ